MRCAADKRMDMRHAEKDKGYGKAALRAALGLALLLFTLSAVIAQTPSAGNPSSPTTSLPQPPTSVSTTSGNPTDRSKGKSQPHDKTAIILGISIPLLILAAIVLIILSRKKQADKGSSEKQKEDKALVSVRNKIRCRHYVEELRKLAGEVGTGQTTEFLPQRLNKIVYALNKDKEPLLANLVQRYGHRCKEYVDKKRVHNPVNWRAEAICRNLQATVTELIREAEKLIKNAPDTPATDGSKTAADTTRTATETTGKRLLTEPGMLDTATDGQVLTGEDLGLPPRTDYIQYDQPSRKGRTDDRIAQLQQQHQRELQSVRDKKDAEIRRLQKEIAQVGEQYRLRDGEKKALSEEMKGLTDAETVQRHLRESLASFPPSLKSFVTGLIEVAHRAQSGDMGWLSGADGMQKLDQCVYRPAPAFGALALEPGGQVEPADLQRVVSLQSWVHARLKEIGLEVISPLAGEEFNLSLHAFTDEDLVEINEAPERHGRIARTKRIGYRSAHTRAVLRKADVQRWVYRPYGLLPDSAAPAPPVPSVPESQKPEQPPAPPAKPDRPEAPPEQTLKAEPVSEAQSDMDLLRSTVKKGGGGASS
jgi:hypothetical protein